MLATNMKIAIFGTYPPPIGGTSIHVKRLYELLSKKYRVRVYDTYGKSDSKDKNIVKISNYKTWIIKYMFTCDDDIIHSHSHSWNERCILTLVSKIRQKKIMFTYHSFRDEWNNFSISKKFSFKIVSKFGDLHIATNDEIKEKLISWGINKDKIVVVPAFLLPTKSEEYELKSDIVEKIHKLRENNELIICANSSNNNKYKGEDLYGIDLCIDLCAKLKEKYNIGFVFSITKITDQDYYQELINRVKNKGLEEKFIFINENISFLPIINLSDMFIRPTNTDGFSISVGESLHLKKPTIASDVCKRNEGTVIFRNRDIEDLYNKTIDLIENYQQKSINLKHYIVKDYSDEILNVYENIKK